MRIRCAGVLRVVRSAFPSRLVSLHSLLVSRCIDAHLLVEVSDRAGIVMTIRRARLTMPLSRLNVFGIPFSASQFGFSVQMLRASRRFAAPLGLMMGVGCTGHARRGYIASVGKFYTFCKIVKIHNLML